MPSQNLYTSAPATLFILLFSTTALLLYLHAINFLHPSNRQRQNNVIHTSESSRSYLTHFVPQKAYQHILHSFTPSSTPSDLPKPSKPSIFSSLSSWFLHFFPFTKPSSTSNFKSSHTAPFSSLHPESPFHKVYRTAQIKGVHVAYHNPFTDKSLRGVALLFHGCLQDAKDWFQLPEHRNIAAHLLHNRLALLAITSENRVTACWSTRFPAHQNSDAERVNIVTHQWLTDHHISPQTPLIGVAISSGATMLSVLAASQFLPALASQVLYISPGNMRAFHNATSNYPNTLFVHVMADHYYASPSAIESARSILLKRGVKVVGELPLGQIHLLPLTFHHHEPRITRNMSRRLFAAAKKYNGDVEKAAMLSADEVVRNLWINKELGRGVQQIARVVRGAHEVSARHADLVAEWAVMHA